MKIVSMDTYRDGCLYTHRFIADLDAYSPDEQRELLSGGFIIDADGDEVSISVECLDEPDEGKANCFNRKELIV